MPADPIYLDTDDKVADFAKTLRAAGWEGQHSFGGRENGEGAATDKIKASKGRQTIDVRTGFVVVDVDDGNRYLQYPQSEFEELQAVLGGNS